MSKPIFTIAKRAIDLGVSSVGLVTLAPVLVVISILIKLTSRGPVIFAQSRAGRGGVTFEILKFRTMEHAPENGLSGGSEYGWEGGVPDEFVFKGSANPSTSITRVGRYLRRWSLDELPQLLNVWRGEMSLVGPRPEILAIANCYSLDQRRRLQVRPGITGWAQVNGRSSVDHGRKIAADLYYIDQASLRLDLRILARTVGVALSGRNAH